MGLDAHIYIPDVLDQVRALERRWVERDLRAQIDEQLDIDALFDEDGDYIGEIYQPRRRRSLFVAPEPHEPTMFTDLINRIDLGAPDPVTWLFGEDNDDD